MSEQATHWDPKDYLSFQEERFLPFDELLQLRQASCTASPSLRAVDLGCGTGELTKRFAEHFHGEVAHTLGIDNAPAMLKVAQSRFASPRVEFQQHEMNAFLDAQLAAGHCFDLVLSNAALHWLPDHSRLFSRLSALADPKHGELLLQIPANHHHPVQTTLAELAGQEPHRERLGGFTRQSPVLPAADYSRLLAEHGFTQQRVLERVYAHPMPDAGFASDFVRSSTATEYQAHMKQQHLHFPQFMAEHRALMLRRFPQKPYLFTFNRLLMWAKR
mmetsp:Transcript_13195/g.33683  ORF Transcript_13195/g.33683 Transcript_13195/m.33683 type:complete len:274 (+) Transcript_13195:1068-1889(+)